MIDNIMFHGLLALSKALLEANIELKEEISRLENTNKALTSYCQGFMEANSSE